MNSNQIQVKRYIEINNEQISVSEEVYLAYKRPLWAEYKRNERITRCRDQNGNRCKNDCSTCKHDRTGRPLSLERLAEDGYEGIGTNNVEAYVLKKLLYEALYAAMDKLGPDNLRIAILHSEGLSERRIAVEVGLSQRGVNKKIHKIIEQLREQLWDYR